ncbi:MAG: iron-sulfur cluster assembly accessory protein [Ilumatobacter sp.]|jgi:iron-sulfur cluster assembly accessory protein|uniref:HesB/IscA family protein n=1 Tax=Ilumatobacter sp. TaxID=1967498 RepID=UPI001DC2AE12|nr:iron-sulfur cluster assembly accessory protein [Ilumatobacter sp.]MBT5276542.1 iron-sulfur cluster assembly accessory protein [Ilumatobacter sp.]MBT5553894.1 iron-sulfur cluster assembly accessory protein [Ilumatobacter sp.]MBT5865570.1 iron-sulfur cluster assembly accessory protein [Ilumatobacter sp.]MDG0975465.1 iron-sulfur cluster assembly accessory protein [Ilumatobacter sp.]
MITLTDTATEKVGQLLAAEGAEELALRVAVRPGGCSGFSYEMFFDGDIAADDNQTSYGDDGKVRVVVDQASAQLLEGATLDYKDGLDESGFAITNPNATRTCGCGSSFS